MAIINRELDASEKKRSFQAVVAGTVTGSSTPICMVPWQATWFAASEAAIGLSGTPTSQLVVERFNASGGQTIMTGFFSTITSRALGTSGPQGYSNIGLAASLPLLPGDVISLYSAGTNAAVSKLAVNIVLQAIDDYKAFYTGF